jgi:hypothetical protein
MTGVDQWFILRRRLYVAEWRDYPSNDGRHGGEQRTGSFFDNPKTALLSVLRSSKRSNEEQRMQKRLIECLIILALRVCPEARPKKSKS